MFVAMVVASLAALAARLLPGVVDVQDNADFMAASSSLYELMNVLLLVLMVLTTSDWSRDPLVSIAAAPLLLIPLLEDPSEKMM